MKKHELIVNCSIYVTVKANYQGTIVKFRLTNVLAIHLDSTERKYGLYQVEITAEGSKHSTKSLFVREGQSQSVSSTGNWGLADLFDPSERRFFVHSYGGKKTFKVCFKAGMLKLHRQCFALINFVHSQKDSTCARTDQSQGSQLLAALVYFHQRDTDRRSFAQPAPVWVWTYSLLAHYVAKSFAKLSLLHCIATLLLGHGIFSVPLLPKPTTLFTLE